MKKLLPILVAIAMINFAAFVIGALVLGGDAVSGKVQGGRYYVSNHGKLTEVSQAAYTYSRYHCYAVWITHPLAIFYAMLLAARERLTRSSS